MKLIKLTNAQKTRTLKIWKNAFGPFNLDKDVSITSDKAQEIFGAVDMPDNDGASDGNINTIYMFQCFCRINCIMQYVTGKTLH